MKKKLIVIPAVALGLGGLITFGVCGNKMILVKAEGEEETTEIVEETTSEEELTEEEASTLEEVKAFLGQYVNQATVSMIISALTSTGFLGGLLATLIKYKKYKAMSSKEIANKVEDAVKDCLLKCFNEMSVEELSKVIDGINKVTETNEAVIKALVLAQDKSVEGKLALLDLLKSKTDSVETTKLIEETKEELVEEQERKDEVVEKVSGDYENIF